MSERKVLNKYYPPDFDPNNIPRAKRAKNQTFNIRLMAPFNMRCKTCGEYIYKGKKFNSRKENVENEFYLGIQIYRFYIKCPMCIAEISFRTDPENTDYEIESGATRNFEALRTAEKMAIQEEKERKEAENSDPMKLLESRTKASRHEMEELEALEDLRELRRKQQLIDSNDLIVVNKKLEPIEEDLDEDEKELEETIKYHFGCIKRVAPIDSADPPTKMPRLETFKKPIVATASKKTLDVYDKIRACIKPKVKVEKKEPEEEVKAPQLPALPTSAICASTPEPLKIAVSVEEPTESAQSSLKLIDYSDSDEE